MVQKAPTLKGRTIAITRPSGQTDETANIIRKKGGVPYFIPTIEIKELTDLSPIKAFIEELAAGKVDYVIFMSINGVKHLLSAAEKLKMLDKLMQGLEKPVMIAVGPRTAEELKANQIHVNLVPTKYTSESIAESLEQLEIEGKTVFIPRTSAANPTLKEKLEKMGASVQEVYVYASSLPADDNLKQKFLQDLDNGKVHAIIFGSALTAKNLFQMLSEQVSSEKLRDLLNEKVTVVAIGPVTAEVVVELGLKVAVMPQMHLFEEALTALANYWNNH
jgi:uroporphyrinogen-III synthase